jgi:hypothetical protein
MTTTPFKIDLIVPCIGMNRLTSQSKTPSTIKTITTCIKGMSLRAPHRNAAKHPKATLGSCGSPRHTKKE